MNLNTRIDGELCVLPAAGKQPVRVHAMNDVDFVARIDEEIGERGGNHGIASHRIRREERGQQAEANRDELLMVVY